MRRTRQAARRCRWRVVAPAPAGDDAAAAVVIAWQRDAIWLKHDMREARDCRKSPLPLLLLSLLLPLWAPVSPRPAALLRLDGKDEDNDDDADSPAAAAAAEDEDDDRRATLTSKRQV